MDDVNLGKLIKSQRLARYLLKEGFTIIDIKAHKDSRDRTVFVFKKEEGLSEAMSRYIESVEKIN